MFQRLISFSVKRGGMFISFALSGPDAIVGCLYVPPRFQWNKTIQHDKVNSKSIGTPWKMRPKKNKWRPHFDDLPTKYYIIGTSSTICGHQILKTWPRTVQHDSFIIHGRDLLSFWPLNVSIRLQYIQNEPPFYLSFSTLQSWHANVVIPRLNRLHKNKIIQK